MDFLSDIVLSKDVVQALFNMDEDITSACDSKAMEICIKLFPDIDLSREENVDLVVRPMSAVIALNEMLLENLMSMSSIDGVYKSKTLSSSLKSMVLKNFGRFNGVQTISADVDSIYSELKFALKTSSMNRESSVKDRIYNAFSEIDRVVFIDNSDREMNRSKIPYIQISSSKIMTFERAESNQGTLLGCGYDRRDFQKYKAYKDSEFVVMPGMLDIYFSTEIVEEVLSVPVTSAGRYILPSGYYISITPSLENFAIIEDDTRYWGITETAPELHIQGGAATEEIHVVRYKSISPSLLVDPDEFSIMDILFKGLYPIFVDFTCYTRSNVDGARIKSSIDSYLSSVGGNMSEISMNDMVDLVRKNGDDIAMSSSNPGRIVTTTNIGADVMLTFPISMKDINIPIEYNPESISERTTKVFCRNINVVHE